MTLATSTILSPNHYIGRQGKHPSIIGIHTMEAPESGNTAEAVARYFGNPAIQASSHWCVDDNSRVRTVADDNAAWTMPPLNDQSLNVEMAGYAAQTVTQWSDSYSEETLDNVALCVAEWCHKYGIPYVHLNDSQIAAGHSGIVGHVDVNRVYHASTHTDPGPHFPWAEFLLKVRAHFDNMPQATQPASGSCTALQLAVGADTDNVWGADTDKRCMTVKWAAASQFPNGVLYANEVIVGSKATNFWTADSKIALTKTITSMQRALITMGYLANNIRLSGTWAPSTDAAFLAARKHFHG